MCQRGMPSFAGRGGASGAGPRPAPDPAALFPSSGCWRRGWQSLVEAVFCDQLSLTKLFQLRSRHRKVGLGALGSCDGCIPLLLCCGEFLAESRFQAHDNGGSVTCAGARRARAVICLSKKSPRQIARGKFGKPA
jgi:hypothetical protein